MKFITIQLLVKALFTQPSIKMQVGIASVMGQFEKGGTGVPPVNHPHDPQDCACHNQTDPLPCFRERTATPLRPFDLENLRAREINARLQSVWPWRCYNQRTL